MYSSVITYPVYDSNSTLFLELIREILQTEFLKQISDFDKTFLPIEVKKDEYLLNPISDKEINPAFCSVIKAKAKNAESPHHDQENMINNFVIGVLANGLENLKKISDAIFIILNDMDVKNYLFHYKNGEDLLISDSSKYNITDLSNEFEVPKTINNKNIVYGNLILSAQIAEVAKVNTYPEIEGSTSDLSLGENEIIIKQTTNF